MENSILHVIKNTSAAHSSSVDPAANFTQHMKKLAAPLENERAVSFDRPSSAQSYMNLVHAVL